MENLKSKDIEALREYLDKLEDLTKEQPQAKITQEEWKDFFSILEQTGKFPAKYKGRIAVKKEKVFTDTVDGIPIAVPEGKEVQIYYDVAFEEVNKKYYTLQRKYRDSIIKVFEQDGSGEGKKSLVDMIKAAVVLDTSNLPNALITDERLRYALTTKKNDYAYIVPFDYGQLSFEYNEEGEIVVSSKAVYDVLEAAKDEEKNKEALVKAAKIDQPLLRQLFSAILKAYLCDYGNSVTVYIPSFAREMGIDVYYSNLKAEERNTGKKQDIPKHNSSDFFKKLEEFEKFGGVWEGGGFYRLFIFEGHNPEDNTLTFSSPWFFKIARELHTTPTNTKTKADGSIMWKIVGLTGLIKPSIVSARSKPTVEILAALLVGVKQRGTTPNAKGRPGRKYADKDLIEYSISFKTLINRIPLIMENLKNSKDSNKTTLLQRYFCGTNPKKRKEQGKPYILEEYINQYTFIKDYFVDFKITFNPPTIKTLSEKIIIQHRGINGHFTQDNALKEHLFQEVIQEESVVNQED